MAYLKRSDQNRRNRVNEQARLKTRIVHNVPPGWHLVPHAASDMTACGCVTHTWGSTDAAAIAWTINSDDRYRLRCLSCRMEFTRAILLVEAGRGTGYRRNVLAIDATHPEEQSRRAQLRRNRAGILATVDDVSALARAKARVYAKRPASVVRRRGPKAARS